MSCQLGVVDPEVETCLGVLLPRALVLRFVGSLGHLRFENISEIIVAVP